MLSLAPGVPEIPWELICLLCIVGQGKGRLCIGV